MALASALLVSSIPQALAIYLYHQEVADKFARLQAGRSLETVQYILDCRWDEQWSKFLDMLNANAANGFPASDELYLHAIYLHDREPHMWSVEQADNGWLKTSLWSAFIDSLCQPLDPQDDNSYKHVCLYGVIAALWVIARHGGTGDFNSTIHMRRANTLIGRPANELDFTEESSWPIGSFHALASLEAKEHVRRVWERTDIAIAKHPWTIRERLISSPLDPIGDVIAEIPAVHDTDHGLKSTAHLDSSLLHAWEFGNHKSLSAEILTTLHHAALELGGSGIHARNVISRQYPGKVPRCEFYKAADMDCNPRSDQLNAIAESEFIYPGRGNHFSPTISRRMLERTAERLEAYGSKLASDVDLVVITQPAVLLTMVLGMPCLREKPIVMYISTLLCYMVEPSDRKWFLDAFRAASRDRKNTFTVTDTYVQLYAHTLSGVTVPAVRGQAYYTGTRPVENATRGLLVLERPADHVLLCILKRLLAEMEPAHQPHELVSTRQIGGYWQEMAKFSAAAFFPKTFFGMLFEEVYSFAVPIFVPQRLSKTVFDWWFTVGVQGPPESLRVPYDPWRPSTYDYLTLCEYFRRPLVDRFDSLTELLLRGGPSYAAELQERRRAMRHEGASARHAVLKYWGAVLMGLRHVGS